jgi:membrane-associated protease RseP (regulator of RpoE activity)
MRALFTLFLLSVSAFFTLTWSQSTVKVKMKKEVNGQIILEEKVFQLEDGQDLEEALKANGIDKKGAMEFSISIENNAQLPMSGGLDIIGFPFEMMPEGAAKPYLGITLKNDHGQAVVTEVNPMSPAEKSNVKQGDVILKIDDHKVNGANDLVEYIQTKKPGEMVDLKVKRDHKRYKLTVRLGVGQNGGGQPIMPNFGLPGFPDQFRWEDVPFSNESKTAFLGVMPNNGFAASGVQVDSVIQSSAAEKMGILKGDVIIAINGTSIADFDDLRNYVSKQQPDSKCEVTLIRNEKTIVLEGAFGAKSIIIKDGMRIYKNEKGLDDQGQLNLDYELDWQNNLDSNVQMLIDENGIQIMNGNKEAAQLYIENYTEDVFGLLKEEVVIGNNFENLSFIPDNEEKQLQIHLTYPQPSGIRLQVVNQDNLVVLSDERGEKTTSYQQSIKYGGWKKGTYLLKVYQNEQLSLVKKLIVQ